MRTIATLVCALLLHLTHRSAIAQPVTGCNPPTSALTRLLEAKLARLPAKSGIYVKHLTTGEQAAVRADEEFESASTIKVAIMVLAFRLSDQNMLNLNERYVITSADFRGGGIFRFKDPGLNPTLRDLVMEMIITSDNTATEIILGKIGGKGKVNEFLRESGYKGLRQNHTPLEFFRLSFEAIDAKYKDLTPEDVFALMSDVPYFVEPRRTLIKEVTERFQSDAAKSINLEKHKENWFGWATPAEMARLLEGIERCTVASQSSCAEMKRMLRSQQLGDMRLPHYLTVPIAHKDGKVGTFVNDAGMIYARSGTIIVSFYSRDRLGSSAEISDGIGRVAQLIVDYFDGVDYSGGTE